MINERALSRYLKERYPFAKDVRIERLGAGVQGAGFLVELSGTEGPSYYVVKRLFPEGLGHDYPSDRAAVFLLDLEEYGNLPRHVKAIDVLAEMDEDSVRSIGGGREYYLLMERGEGRSYFEDLSSFAEKGHLEEGDKVKIRSMASYLAEIHALKKNSRGLYFRKLRDTIGHGECLMGVFDTYPDGVLSYTEMAKIEKMCIDWRARLKPMSRRLCRIHGDFHPGNIWFKNESDFVLLDRSRGPWGEPADDVTALGINYVFYSVMHHGEVRGAFREGIELFFDEYIHATGDRELTGAVAPFFAFRAAVVANPLFYPDLSADARKKIFRFTRNVLDAECFEVGMVNEYLQG